MWEFNISILSDERVANESSSVVDVRVPDGNVTSLLNFNNLRQAFNDKSSELTVLNKKYALLGSESKKKSNNQQAQIIILKTKLKIEEENFSLVSTKLEQEINENATKNTIKNTTSNSEMELNDPLGKFGN